MQLTSWLIFYHCDILINTRAQIQFHHDDSRIHNYDGDDEYAHEKLHLPGLLLIFSFVLLEYNNFGAKIKSLRSILCSILRNI